MDLTGLLLLLSLLVIGGGIHLLIRNSGIMARKPEPTASQPTHGELARKVSGDQDDFETAEELFPPIEFPPDPIEEYVPELPEKYNEDRITLMTRDPFTLFAYWEVTDKKINNLRDVYSSHWETSVPVIRIHDVTGIDFFNGTNSNSLQDVIINDHADKWYFNICSPDRAYCVELGRKLEDGTFIIFARSNMAQTPRNSLSDKIDPEWMLVTDDQKKLYGRIGKTGEFSSYHLFGEK